MRDVAKVHAAVLEPGHGPRRYMAGGTFLRFAGLVAGFVAETGHCLSTITMPAPDAAAIARAVQLVQHITPVHIPVEFEGAHFIGCAARCDHSHTRQELGAPATSR